MFPNMTPKIGIDLGGTKTEGILINDEGKELARNRIKPIFINSEGCKFIKYKSNHLLEPDDVNPKYLTPRSRINTPI